MVAVDCLKYLIIGQYTLLFVFNRTVFILQILGCNTFGFLNETLSGLGGYSGTKVGFGGSAHMGLNSRVGLRLLCIRIFCTLCNLKLWGGQRFVLGTQTLCSSSVVSAFSVRRISTQLACSSQMWSFSPFSCSSSELVDHQEGPCGTDFVSLSHFLISSGYSECWFLIRWVLDSVGPRDKVRALTTLYFFSVHTSCIFDIAA